jgi:hypothetical protein
LMKFLVCWVAFMKATCVERDRQGRVRYACDGKLAGRRVGESSWLPSVAAA